MFVAIKKNDLPKNLKTLKLSSGTLNTNSRLFTSDDKVYKLYQQELPFGMASELYELGQEKIAHALFPEAFIIDDKYHVIGDVTPYMQNSQTLTQESQIDSPDRLINSRIPKMHQLISFVSRLNELSYYHNDLHSDNFLADDFNIYAIDLVGIRKGKNISEHQKHLNEILLSYLFGLTKTEANSLLTNQRYKLQESLYFAPKFLHFLINGAIEREDSILNELYNHDKEATEIHKSSKSM